MKRREISMSSKYTLIPVDRIERSILLIRCQEVSIKNPPLNPLQRRGSHVEEEQQSVNVPSRDLSAILLAEGTTGVCQ